MRTHDMKNQKDPDKAGKEPLQIVAIPDTSTQRSKSRGNGNSTQSRSRSGHISGRKALPKTEPANLHYYTHWETIEKSQSGLEPDHIRKVSEALGITLKELAEVLNVSEATLHRKNSRANEMPVHIAEHVMLLEALAKHGYEVYAGEPETFLRFLQTPQWKLYDKTPLSLLSTKAGISVVDNMLTRIDYKEFS